MIIKAIKIISVNLLIFLVISIVGCNKKTDNVQQHTDYAQQYIDNYVPSKTDSNRDAEPLQHYVFDLMQGYVGDGIYLNISSGVHYLGEYCNRYDTKLQKIDTNNIFAITKVALSDNQTIYALARYFWFKDNLWLNGFEYYFISDIMEQADFSSVKVGDRADLIYQIDPAIKGDFENRVLHPHFISTGKEFRSYRLLKDGMLVIDFALSGNADVKERTLSDFVVKKIEFYDYNTAKEPIEIDDFATLRPGYQSIHLPEQE